MKYLITESQYNKAIDKFVTYQFEPHDNKKVSDGVVWIKDNKIVAEVMEEAISRFDKHGRFCVDNEIWKTISNMFSLDYGSPFHSETQSVIKTWLEKHYNLGKLTPRPTFFQKNTN